jgi:hypothetical protein
MAAAGCFEMPEHHFGPASLVYVFSHMISMLLALGVHGLRTAYALQIALL